MRSEHRIAEEAECPHCTYRFETPETDFELNEELECPQCGMGFRVSSTAPLEFDHWDPWVRRPPFVWEMGLVGRGRRYLLESPDSVSVLLEIASKQGAREVALRIRRVAHRCVWGVAEVSDLK